ncbi:hypothetical protein [uncultured Aquimarina sp.]|uniref:hypothetical protein n=1 Tax=uncultured Aquimarina sp. TaxID=575652 RepID=UPI002628DFB8|nr:hypothetical protein [uncultured Aquimarina sp.]
MKRILVIIIIQVLFSNLAIGQSEMTINLDKGQVLDVLLRINADNVSEKTENRFFEKLVPRAFELGYHGIPYEIHIDYPALQGNHTPDHILFGRWDSLKNREEAMEKLVKEFPDFHELRREIWTSLYAVFFKVPRDLSFSFQKGKYYVITFYWSDEKKTFKKFENNWLGLIQKYKGKTILDLYDGISPITNYYSPDYMNISQWNNEEKYREFYRESLKVNNPGIKNVHQFGLLPKFKK